MDSKTIQSIVDQKGHYDLDGVSYDGDHVNVASDKLTNPSELGSLEQIEEDADKNSLKLKNKKTSDQVYSAKYHSEFIDFLKYEKAGD